MIGRVLILGQALSEWGAFGVDGAGVLSYIGLALDRMIVQSSNVVHLESEWGPLNECSFASVCLSRCFLERQEKICTFVKLQCILMVLNIL